MNNLNEERYQIATLVVVVVTVLVCMCYLLIFVNPQVSLNPLKPPTGAPTAIAFGLQSTWTPTATQTPSPTGTSTRTPTTTPTPPPTETPTLTPVPVTATRRPPTRIPTPRATPTAAFLYRPANISCAHSGGTFIKGTVWNRSQPESGVTVRVSWAPNGGPAANDQTTGSQGDGSTTYTFVLKDSGSFGATPANWYVWVLDGNGNPASDPNAAHIVTNNLPDGDPNSCWFAIVDFTR
jgi:hypothetical protein